MTPQQIKGLAVGAIGALGLGFLILGKEKRRGKAKPESGEATKTVTVGGKTFVAKAKAKAKAKSTVETDATLGAE